MRKRGRFPTQGCLSKNKYDTRQQADDTARRMEPNGTVEEFPDGPWFYSYKCSLCEGYHIARFKTH